MSSFYKTTDPVEEPSYPRQSPICNPWRPGWHRIPWWGLGGLLVALAGIIAAILLLCLSNNDSIDRWKYQPAVYLAIASTATNVGLASALFQGIVITWWQKALRYDTTIADLHRVWHHGTSVRAALLSGRWASTVAIASILVAISPINGPFLQRASTIGTIQSTQTREIKLQVSNLIPSGWTGISSLLSDQIIGLTTDFTPTARDYYEKSIIQFESGCNGRCDGTLIAAGFSASCSTTQLAYNMAARQNHITVFSTSAKFSEWSAPTIINLSSLYKSTRGCLGQLQQQNCALRAGTVRYPVTFDGDVGSIGLRANSTIWDDISIGNADVNRSVGLRSTYGGMTLVLSNQWTSNLTVDTGVTEYFPGKQYDPNGATTAATLSYAQNLDDMLGCNATFNDPMPAFLEAARNLMFRTALASVSGNTPSQQIEVIDSFTSTVYHTHYLFLGLAIGFSTIALIAVSLTFNRFWTLGRSFTLSPVETAKAFNALVLRGSDSNAPLKNLLKVVGNRKVQYGTVMNADPGLEGGWVPSDNELEPLGVDDTGGGRRGSTYMRQRLELADPIKVAPIMVGSIFRE